MRSSYVCVMVAAALTPAGAVVAGAIDVPVVNPSFEDISGEAPFNEFTFGPLNGWDLHDPMNVTDGGDGPVFYIGTLTPFEADPVGNPGVYVYFPAGAPDGDRVAIAFNFQGSDGLGEYGLVQELDETFEPNTRYVLRVEVGNIASGTAMSGEFFPLEGFPGYRVELLAGGEPIACDDNSLAGSIPEGEFRTSTVVFPGTLDHEQLGERLSIRLVNLNTIDPAFPDSDLEVDFDHVRLAANPCPADLDGDGMVGGGDLALLLGAWGGDFQPGAPEDLNGDGTIGGGDLAFLLGAWGACP